MTEPVKLVHDAVSHDTVAALEQLLHDAKVKKKLIGIAFVGIYRGPERQRRFIANAAGELYRLPDIARGYVAQLHDLLGKLSRGEQMPPGW